MESINTDSLTKCSHAYRQFYIKANFIFKNGVQNLHTHTHTHVVNKM